MDEVGGYVVEQALIVGDHDDGFVWSVELIDALGDDPQRVDVEAGVGLVEDRQLGFQHGHLQNFVALFLAAGKAFIDRPLEEVLVHFHQGEPFAD